MTTVCTSMGFDFGYIKSSLHHPVLNSLFSSFASFAPSWLNHSDTTGIDITSPLRPIANNAIAKLS
ncbi:hypothetical protein [Microcoleus sp.]|uniref:hypothetical protein n=1 Tax=Microcoleus sp. TaxID=44472 RepID=UPI003525D2C8